MTREIPLTQGKVALVSDHRFAFLSQFVWYAHKNRHGKWYAVRSVGKNMVWMHRVIMNPPDNMEVDHRDGDGLNNQDENLRIATHAQNMINSKKIRANNTTGYRGIFRKRKKWVAQVQKHGKCVFSKTYPTAEEAARGYDQAARRHFGEFAVLNFPNDYVT